MTNGEQNLIWKFRRPIKILLSSENSSGEKKRDSNFCVFCIYLHLTGDMSQGQPQETNLKINLGEDDWRESEKGAGRKKGEKHQSTYFIPLGQRERKKWYLLEG